MEKAKTKLKQRINIHKGKICEYSRLPHIIHQVTSVPILALDPDNACAPPRYRRVSKVSSGRGALQYIFTNWHVISTLSFNLLVEGYRVLISMRMHTFKSLTDWRRTSEFQSREYTRGLSASMSNAKSSGFGRGATVAV